MENTVKSKINETISSIFSGVEGLANTKRVIGEPYTIGETTIIPFIETSMGFGVGDMKDNRETAGAGCKVKPIACLIIQNGFTKLINIDSNDSISKALDIIPDLVDKLLNKNSKNRDINEAIRNIKSDYQS